MRTRSPFMFVLVTLATLLPLARSAAQDPADTPIRFARHPALSPDGQQVAFAYQGDLWTVPTVGGRALRVTLHEGHDQLPAWSPDGKWLAFSSNRAGNYDVWVMPVGGGKARQLTFHSADDSVSAWSPDGSAVLFASARETTRTPAIYAVDLVMGRSHLLAADEIALANGALSSDGKWVAATRGRDWWRKGYRGSGNANLIRFPVGLPPAPGEGTQSGDPTGDAITAAREPRTGGGQWIARDPENERWPLFSPDGKIIYFVSDRDGANNLYRMSAEGGNRTALTRFRDGNLFYPNLARNGARLVFERNFGLWILDAKGGEPQEIRIFAPSDDRSNLIRPEAYTTGAQEAMLSPDGKQLALVVRGEVFVLPAAGGNSPKRITTTPSREEDVAWSPNSRQLAFASDRDGDQDLFVADVDGKTQRRLTRTAGISEHSPVFSPDGKALAFLRGYNGAELCIAPADGEADGAEPRVLVRDPAMSGLAWSPDARWIAYARTRAHSAGTQADVFVVSLEDARRINVSSYPVVNRAPAWSRDGKRLYFLSDRTGSPQVWRVLLQRGDASDEPEVGNDPAGERSPSVEQGGPVTIEEQDLDERARQVTRADTGVQGFAVAPDGRSVLFTQAQLGRTDIWRAPTTGSGTATRVTQSGEAGLGLHFAADGARAVYRAGGGARSVALPAGTVMPILFRAQMDLDVRAELFQMFDEAWRKMRDSFYDERLHGANWIQVRSTYRPIVGDITYKEDFYALFSLVLGELNASHTGISAAGGGGGAATANPGVAVDDRHPGPGVKIAFVMPESPAAREKTRLQAGEYIVKVDGFAVNTAEEYAHRLAGKAGRSVELLVGRGPREEGARAVTLRPLSGVAYRALEYDRWVKERKQRTAQLSENRFVYLHLNAMNDANLERFRRVAFGEGQEKEGLVLDLRFNGGGSIADEMLAILQDRIFSYRTMRGSSARLPAPLQVFTRPVVVLINEGSFSNAEAFPWGFKALKLGKIVGVPTFGGCIGTGATTLIDGSTLRTPSTGAYTLDGINMENNGCPPDIYVENTPADVAQGHDRQLGRAVEELLKQVRRTR